ncbi:MAG TPA: aldo/keto reductase [Fimbriimonas sp.]|nr:aldo/keto reductase [Fimbriimonas sp.]
MEFRNLGKSGLSVSVVGLGCNNFGRRIDLEATRDVVHRALDAGITLFDTADVYGEGGASETMLGQVLGHRRKDIVLATKFGHSMGESEYSRGASRRYIANAVEASLTRLKTDYIDLYQLHTPDPKTPMEETLAALDDLVRAGKVRYIGCSNVPAWQVADALWISRTRGLSQFVSCQDEYSMLVRDVEKELTPMTQQFGLGILPYFPLASGMLTGKYKRDEPGPAGARLTDTKRLSDRYFTDDYWNAVERYTQFAEARGHTLLELAFSWLAAQPTVSSVIAGATKPEQVEKNVSAADWKLTEEELASL